MLRYHKDGSLGAFHSEFTIRDDAARITIDELACIIRFADCNNREGDCICLVCDSNDTIIYSIGAYMELCICPDCSSRAYKQYDRCALYTVEYSAWEANLSILRNECTFRIGRLIEARAVTAAITLIMMQAELALNLNVASNITGVLTLNSDIIRFITTLIIVC